MTKQLVPRRLFTGPEPSTHKEWLECAGRQSDRLFARIDRRGDHECWPWTGGVDEDGYGKFQITGGRKRQKTVRAHKLVWELANGPVPDGLVIRHSCDNPPCCNPNHLAPGTQSQNRDDCVQRGRQPRGEQHGMARLTADGVRAIRARVASGEPYQAIADDYGIETVTVTAIKMRRIWRHVA